MKQTYSFVGLLMIVILLNACLHKKVEAAQTDEWPELETFHTLMAEVYHPYKDGQDLKPAKALADTLAMESVRWMSATRPASMNNDDVKLKLEKLNADCQKVATLVKQNATDEEIGAALERSHDSFHAVMEAWHAKGEHKEH